MSRFAAASAQCDVMLDSIGWSGGNTTLEALAQDLPVVTFEGELMRGRVSAGILRMMGMPEAIAGDDRRLRRARGPHRPGRRLAGGDQDAHRQRQAPALSRPRPASPRWKISSTAPRARNSTAAALAANARAQIPSIAPTLSCIRARHAWLALRCFSWLANAEHMQHANYSRNHMHPRNSLTMFFYGALRRHAITGADPVGIVTRHPPVLGNWTRKVHYYV